MRLFCYAHYSVLQSLPVGDPSSSNNRVREAIPWLRTLSSARLQDFRRAAAFEWLLDQTLHAGASEDGVQALEADLAQFAGSSDLRDLPFDSAVFRFPPTLLDWYQEAIKNNEFSFEDEHKEQIKASISVPRSPANRKSVVSFLFLTLMRHLDICISTYCNTKSLNSIAFVSISAAIRCRCSKEIGTFSSFNMLTLTKRFFFP